MTDRLYIIVRSDLAPGLQMAQACHVAMAWQEQHGAAPENVVVLHATSEDDVCRLYERACGLVVPASLFREPDLGNAVTAAAVGGQARRIVSSLPLALRAA